MFLTPAVRLTLAASITVDTEFHPWVAVLLIDRL
jgi:hypothetical protein